MARKPIAEAQVLEAARRMFVCDTARIERMSGTEYLVLGHRSNTRYGRVPITKNGQPVSREYMSEHFVASGETPEALLVSARTYRRVYGNYRQFVLPFPSAEPECTSGAEHSHHERLP